MRKALKLVITILVVVAILAIIARSSSDIKQEQVNPIVTDSKQDRDSILSAEQKYYERSLVTGTKLIALYSQTSAIDDFDAGLIKYENFLARQNKGIQTAVDIRTELESFPIPPGHQEAVDYKIKAIDTYIDYLQMTIKYAQAKSTNSSMDVMYDIQVKMLDRINEYNILTVQSMASEPEIDPNIQLYGGEQTLPERCNYHPTRNTPMNLMNNPMMQQHR